MKQIELRNGKKIKLVGINDEVNLCDLTFTCNGGVFVVKEKYFETNDINEYGFKIDNPTRFSTYLTTLQYTTLNKKLMEHQKAFKSEFVPTGFFKGQKEPLWNMTLEFGYEVPQRVPNVKVIDFGCSYGELKIDDIEVQLSHSGGSKYDFTDTWCLAGKNRYAAMKYLVELLTKKISLKVA